MNDNENIEVLFDNEENNVVESSVSNVSPVTVVTEAVVPKEVETISVNKNNNIQAAPSNISIPLDYNEYRNSLNQLYATSTYENSIISTFNVDNLKCINTVTLKTVDNSQETKQNGEFVYNNEFVDNFLVPVIIDYNKYNEIFSSNIEILDGDKANFIARTNKNDSIIVMGIDMALANRLKDLVTVKEENPVNDPSGELIGQRGISSYLVIILTIFTIGMTLVGTIFFTIMANK